MDSTEGDVLGIQLLGAFRVWVGSQLIPDTAWRRRKAAGLLKLLALAQEHRVHREEVIELLWPGLPLDARQNNLHRTLHVVRHTLEPNLPRGEHSSYLGLQGDLLVLSPDPELHVDVDAFVEAAMIARQSQQPTQYEQAINLYTGNLLPEDQYEDWAAVRREELRRIYRDLLRHLSLFYEGRGQFDQAIEVLQRLLGSEPTEEGAHLRLMRLYALSGQRLEALQQYGRLIEALQRDMDAEPDPRSQQLAEEIRAGRFPPEPLVAATDIASAPGAAGRPPKAAAATPDPGATPDTDRSTGTPPPTNLPRDLSSFVGRERDLAEVRRLLASSRLLTLTGAGGVGKSRLAMQAAARALADYEDGVWLVQLAAISDTNLLAHAVAALLGVREQPNRPMTEVLAAFLRSKHVLLVLDNCEHLLEACGELTGYLLASCPSLRILATSRRLLGISGEVVWRVPSLTMPDPEHTDPLSALPRSDAVSLFLERTRLVRSSFALTVENAPAVVQVCRRLDGIPLAIELAVARMGVLTVEQLAARLDDCFAVLGGASASLLPRHRTLQAAMDWSHDLLREPERTLFRRLAVFAGGWTLEAAEGICGGEGIEEREVLELLSELVDESLVVVAKQGAAMWYRLLEPVRQYAAQKLVAAGEEAKLRRRHAHWYVALAEYAEPRLIGNSAQEWMTRLENEHDNLRVAVWWLREQGDADDGLRLAGAVCQFWYRHGHLTEGLDWIESLLGVAQHGEHHISPRTRAKATLTAGLLAYHGSDPNLAVMRLEQALQLLRDLEDGIGAALALSILAHRQAALGHAATAQAWYQQGLSLYSDADCRWGRGDVLGSLSEAAWNEGQYRRAVALAEEALALHRQTGDPWNIAAAMTHLGRALRASGQLRRAAQVEEECLALRREIGDTLGIAFSIKHLADIALAGGEGDRAVVLYVEALRRFRDLGAVWGMALCVEGLGAVAGMQGDLEHGTWLFAAAQQYREVTGTPVHQGDRPDHERALAGLRSGMDRARFQLAWTTGRTLSWERVITEAISVAETRRVSPDEEAACVAQVDALTPREHQIVLLLAQGYTNRQIAADLGTSPHTVALQVHRILRKLGASSRTDVALQVVEQTASARS